MSIQINQNNQALTNVSKEESTKLGTFIANEIVTKKGNSVGHEISFNAIENLPEHLMAEIEKKADKRQALFNWAMFIALSKTLKGNTSAGAISKAIRQYNEDTDQLKYLHTYKGNLSTNDRNRLINGYYLAVKELEEFAMAHVRKQMERYSLVPSKLKVKNSGKSSLEFDRMKDIKTAEMKRARKTEAEIREELKAEIMAEVKAELGIQ